MIFSFSSEQGGQSSIFSTAYSSKIINIELSAFDDLFETDESRADKKRERIFDIPLSDIQSFPDHPYKVLDDERMTELVESIKEHGLLQPVLVRPIENNKYEMVSGHRRKRAKDCSLFRYRGPLCSGG